MAAIFEQGLPKSAANHVPLSPLTFIERSASILSLIHISEPTRPY